MHREVGHRTGFVDVHMAARVHRDGIRRAARVDGEIAAGIHGGRARESAVGDFQFAGRADDRRTGDAAREDVHTAVVFQGDRVRRGARVHGGAHVVQHEIAEGVGDEGRIRVVVEPHSAAVFGDRGRRTVVVDPQIAAHVHGDAARAAERVDVDPAARVHDRRVDRAARGDLQAAAGFQSGRVHHAARKDIGVEIVRQGQIVEDVRLADHAAGPVAVVDLGVALEVSHRRPGAGIDDPASERVVGDRRRAAVADGQRAVCPQHHVVRRARRGDICPAVIGHAHRVCHGAVVDAEITGAVHGDVGDLAARIDADGAGAVRGGAARVAARIDFHAPRIDERIERQTAADREPRRPVVHGGRDRRGARVDGRLSVPPALGDDAADPVAEDETAEGVGNEGQVFRVSSHVAAVFPDRCRRTRGVVDPEIRARIHGDVVRRAARGDVHGRPVGDGDPVHRAAGRDRHNGATAHDRVVSFAAGNMHHAARVHDRRVRFTARIDVHIVVRVHGGRVRRTARENVHLTVIPAFRAQQRPVRHAAVGDNRAPPIAHAGRVDRTARVDENTVIFAHHETAEVIALADRAAAAVVDLGVAFEVGHRAARGDVDGARAPRVEDDRRHAAVRNVDVTAVLEPDVVRRAARGDVERAPVGITGKPGEDDVVHHAARVDPHTSRLVRADVVRCAADIQPAAVIDEDVVRHGARGDDHAAVAQDRLARHAAIEEQYVAVPAHEGGIRRAARNVHRTAAHGGFVRHAARVGIETAVGVHEGRVRHAARVDEYFAATVIGPA